MSGAGEPNVTRRLGPSEVARALLERRQNDHATVELGTTARGATTIRVEVTLAGDGGVAMVNAAGRAAEAEYARLREEYPFEESGATAGKVSEAARAAAIAGSRARGRADG